MNSVTSSLKTWSKNNPPAWANDPNFGFKPNTFNTGSKSWVRGASNRYTGGYTWYPYEDNYNPRPQPNPRPNPSPNPNPTPDPNPNPNPDSNTISVSGTRQANGQENFFDLRDQPGSRRNLNIAPNSAAVFNNLNNGVDANVGANFAGYIGGFSTDNTPGVRMRGQGGGVNAIAHSFTTFQDPIDNTAGRAPIDIDLQAGGAPDRMIVIGGEGRINGVENLTLMSSRTGENGNRGFDIIGAENVRIVATSLQEQARQGNTRVFLDDRGSIYRIQDADNRVNVVATGSRDRSMADNTFTDIPGQAPAYGVRQNGALPHDTQVTAADGGTINIGGISPSNNPIAASGVNNQPTPNRGLGTATGGNTNPRPFNLA